jgi:hypothetical protein
VSPPTRDKLTMRIDMLKTFDLILSLSKDEDEPRLRQRAGV